MGQSPIPQGYGQVCAELFVGRGGSGCFGAIVLFIDRTSGHWSHTIQRSAKHVFPLEGHLKNMLPYLASRRLFLILHCSNTHFNGHSHSKLSIPLVDAMIIAYKNKRSLLPLLALRRSAATRGSMVRNPFEIFDFSNGCNHYSMI